jgi:hypothetical protein
MSVRFTGWDGVTDDKGAIEKIGTQGLRTGEAKITNDSNLTESREADLKGLLNAPGRHCAGYFGVQA